MTSGMIVATTLAIGAVMTLLTWGFGVIIGDKEVDEALQASLGWGSVSAGIWAVVSTTAVLLLG